VIPAEDPSRDLRLKLETVVEMPELRTQPFVPLVARLVLGRVSSAQDAVSFSAFVTILAVFSVKQPLELKRQGLARAPVVRSACWLTSCATACSAVRRL
jgi:hypothetical protein